MYKYNTYRPLIPLRDLGSLHYLFVLLLAPTSASNMDKSYKLPLVLHSSIYIITVQACSTVSLCPFFTSFPFFSFFSSPTPQTPLTLNHNITPSKKGWELCMILSFQTWLFFHERQVSTFFFYCLYFTIHVAISSPLSADYYSRTIVRVNREAGRMIGCHFLSIHPSRLRIKKKKKKMGERVSRAVQDRTWGRGADPWARGCSIYITLISDNRLFL